MENEVMQKIIDRAWEIREERKCGGLCRVYNPYGRIPVFEFYEAFSEYLESKLKD